MDPGFSGALRDLARAHSSDQAEQICYLLSDRVLAVLHQWAVTAPTSIHDIECMNAFVRRLQPGGGGRPKDFATAAAHVFLKECATQFAASTGGDLPCLLAEARQSILSLSEARPASRKAGRLPGQRGFDAFCKAEHARLRCAANVHSPRPSGCSPLQASITKSWVALPATAKAVWASTAAASNQANAAAHPEAGISPALPSAPHRQGTWANTRERPRTFTGDARRILTEAEYKELLRGSSQGAKVFEAQWRHLHNEPIGAPGETDFTPEAPRCCRVAGDCDRHPKYIREVARAATTAICGGLRKDTLGTALPSLWRLTWRMLGCVPQPPGCVPGQAGRVPGETTGSGLFLVVHALLGPYRVIVLPVHPTPASASTYRLSYSVGRWGFALLFDHIATCLDPSCTGADAQASMAKLELLHYDPVGWDELSLGEVGPRPPLDPFDLLAGAQADDQLARGVGAITRLLASFRSRTQAVRTATKQGKTRARSARGNHKRAKVAKRPKAAAPKRGGARPIAAARALADPVAPGAGLAPNTAAIADRPVDAAGPVVATDEPVAVAKPVVADRPVTAEGDEAPANSPCEEGPQGPIEDDGWEQWLESAVAEEEAVEESPPEWGARAAEPSLAATPARESDAPDPAWVPQHPHRTDFGLIERVLGKAAYDAMTHAGLVMYWERRRGRHGGYVAKVWLDWPEKRHLYKLPKSEVLLTGPGDHARAIRATFEGARGGRAPGQPPLQTPGTTP